jgi:glycosyltransferase involved in cell wall biosynthesis
LLAPFVWLLARLYGKPVLLDYMIGLADMQEDRGQIGGTKAMFFRQIDRLNLSRMTSITDTQAHVAAFARLLGRSFPRLHVVPVGVRDTLAELPPAPSEGTILVQFVGSYIPFHGVDVILRAAQHLQDDPRITFELIGDGQTYTQSVKLAEQLGLSNVTFTKGFFRPPQLFDLLAKGTILLGVFGNAEKTRYVVPNKVFDAMMFGRPLITAESPALNECFTPGKHLVTVPPGDSQALAEAIKRLAENPDKRDQLRAAGRMRVEKAFLPEHIGPHIAAICEGLIR